MGKNKPVIGFIIGIVVALAIGFSDIAGLSLQGKICMALSFRLHNLVIHLGCIWSY